MSNIIKPIKRGEFNVDWHLRLSSFLLHTGFFFFFFFFFWLKNQANVLVNYIHTNRYYQSNKFAVFNRSPNLKVIWLFDLWRTVKQGEWERFLQCFDCSFFTTGPKWSTIYSSCTPWDDNTRQVYRFMTRSKATMGSWFAFDMKKRSFL